MQRFRSLLESALARDEADDPTKREGGGVEEGLRNLETLGERSSENIIDLEKQEINDEHEGKMTHAERVFEAYKDPKDAPNPENPTNYSALRLAPHDSTSPARNKKIGSDTSVNHSGFTDHLRQVYPSKECSIGQNEREVLQEVLKRVKKVESKAKGVVGVWDDNRAFLRRIGRMWDHDGGREWIED